MISSSATTSAFSWRGWKKEGSAEPRRERPEAEHEAVELERLHGERGFEEGEHGWGRRGVPGGMRGMKARGDFG